MMAGTFFGKIFITKKMISIFADSMRGWGRTEVGLSRTKVGQKSDRVGLSRVGPMRERR